MRLSIGMPNTIPGSQGRLLLEWARRAEDLDFASLSTIGRVAYPGYEELTLLAAAAAATERIGLVTGVLLGPTRDPVLLAKQAASVDQLSGGRFVLGIGIGSREDDYSATGRSFHDRGRRLDHALDLMHRAWRGEPVEGSAKPTVPPPVNGESVPILFGGMAAQAMARTARWGIGWIAGGGGPEMAGQAFERARDAWRAAGRSGEPELRSLTYFALGPAAEQGRAYLLDYYGPFAERIWPSVPRDRESIKETVRRFEEVGTTELVFSPTMASLDQVEELAAALH